MKLIINIDGGSRGNPGPGACGVVMKDEAGEVVLSKGYFLGDCTNNYAEFTALKTALEEAKKMGASDLEVRSDSQLLVRQYTGEYKIKNDVLKELMAKIRVLSVCFARVKINHVMREKNVEADAMVNAALDKGMDVAKNPPKTFAPPARRYGVSHLPPPAPKETPKKKPEPGEQMELF